jgi:hypothetical protein
MCSFSAVTKKQSATTLKITAKLNSSEGWESRIYPMYRGKKIIGNILEKVKCWMYNTKMIAHLF